MQKLIKFNLAHEGTMMRFCEFLSNEIIFHCQILAEQLISAIKENSQIPKRFQNQKDYSEVLSFTLLGSGSE